VVDLQATPPLSAKIMAGDHGPEVFVVSSAASLLEGDDLSIDIELADNCQLTVRTAAAQVAHPCINGGSSTFNVRANVGERSSLRWLPEPTIVSSGAVLHIRSTVILASGAMVLWKEEFVLGRSGESPSAAGLRTELRAEQDGLPLLSDAIDTTRPGAFGSAVLHDARYVASVTCLGFRSSDDQAHQLAGLGSLQRVMDIDVVTGRMATEQAVATVQSS
jgi:urease accessory protein